MNREYRSGVLGGTAVAATFAVMSWWRFDPHPVEIAVGCIALFVIFFALFLRLERKGSMMSPLWTGVFGVAALVDLVMSWFEAIPSGVGLVIDVVFMAGCALLAVVGITAWVREERQRDQRGSAENEDASCTGEERVGRGRLDERNVNR